MLVVVAQSCLTLCDIMDCSPPGSSFHGKEYWSGLPFPPPGDLPEPGIEPRSPTLQAHFLASEPHSKLLNFFVNPHNSDFIKTVALQSIVDVITVTIIHQTLGNGFISLS